MAQWLVVNLLVFLSGYMAQWLVVNLFFLSGYMAQWLVVNLFSSVVTWLSG